MPHGAEQHILICIKLVHTAISLFFVACIVAIPFAAILRRFRWAAALTAVVLVECAVLVANHFRCPLTDLASRYTSDRPANFDIYLPLWLAAHNQAIFGALFSAGTLFALWRWLAWQAKRS